MKKSIVYLVLLFNLGCNTNHTFDWDFQTFYKPDENPIIKADSTLTFVCPVTYELVKWQKADVFNPAAIVKDNKVYLLIRCEDNPEAFLGGRTSRIGLAESEDGIRRNLRPQFLPQQLPTPNIQTAG